MFRRFYEVRTFCSGSTSALQTPCWTHAELQNRRMRSLESKPISTGLRLASSVKLTHEVADVCLEDCSPDDAMKLGKGIFVVSAVAFTACFTPAADYSGQLSILLVCVSKGFTFYGVGHYTYPRDCQLSSLTGSVYVFLPLLLWSPCPSEGRKEQRLQEAGRRERRKEGRRKPDRTKAGGQDGWTDGKEASKQGRMEARRTSCPLVLWRWSSGPSPLVLWSARWQTLAALPKR